MIGRTGIDPPSRVKISSRTARLSRCCLSGGSLIFAREGGVSDRILPIITFSLLRHGPGSEGGSGGVEKRVDNRNRAHVPCDTLDWEKCLGCSQGCTEVGWVAKTVIIGFAARGLLGWVQKRYRVSLCM
jgi:hypothetical protein